MIHDARDDQREKMVRDQIQARGIRNPSVLIAMGRVPRHRFVPPEERHRAYDDKPLPIGDGQTISQPYMVAFMSAALESEPGQRVLEIGTGSGYQTAVLCELGLKVWTVERVPELSRQARDLLEDLGYEGIQYRVGDGTLGWEEAAPFDRIIVTAGAPSLPVALSAQIAEGGRMLIPVGDETRQDLIQVDRADGAIRRRKIVPCVFVKLLGKEGW